jgi:ribosomal protein S18 acetylase RimI-like enzyme
MATAGLMHDREAGAVARLHAESITQGFLTRLGTRFLRRLYLGIAHDDESCVFVAREANGVVGFCAYSRDVGAMYRRVLRASLLRLGSASLPFSLNPWLLKEIFETLRYPAKQRAQSLPAAEILSIAVSDQARGAGIGRLLLNEALRRARADGESAVKVLAGVELDDANRFYERCGFDRAAELIQHGKVLNVYVRDLSDRGDLGA